MVKIPEDALSVSEEFHEKRTQFLHDYAALMMLWAEFELAIEAKIAEIANLAPRDASIIVGSLNFGAKSNILYALLAERNDTLIAPKVRAVIDHAQRNVLIHSSPAGDEATGRFSFFRRDVGNRYVVSHLNFTDKTFNQHWLNFRQLEHEALVAMSFTDETLQQYAREAGLFEPTPPRRRDPHRDEVRREKLARKQRQREAQRDRETRY